MRTGYSLCYWQCLHYLHQCHCYVYHYRQSLRWLFHDSYVYRTWRIISFPAVILAITSVIFIVRIIMVLWKHKHQPLYGEEELRSPVDIARTQKLIFMWGETAAVDICRPLLFSLTFNGWDRCDQILPMSTAHVDGDLVLRYRLSTWWVGPLH